jgi:hypothetical protein
MADQPKAPTWVELESVIPLKSSTGKRNAEQITSLSEDTLKRRYAKYIKNLSDRRRGMKLRHALEIADGSA